MLQNFVSPDTLMQQALATRETSVAEYSVEKMSRQKGAMTTCALTAAKRPSSDSLAFVSH